MIDPKDNKDFLFFINSKGATPPKEIDNKIFNFVKDSLSPSHKIVFLKLLGIQAFLGILTLSFCPQFSLSLTNNVEIFHYFHHTFGKNICMLFCGSIFMGSGAIFAAYILRSAEVRKIEESRLLYYTSISILALSSFFLFGTDVYLTLAAYWLAGSILGGLIIFEVNSLIRKEIFQY